MRFGRIASAVLVTVWLGCAALGMRVLYAYEMGAGDEANPPDQWPAQSQLQAERGQPALLLFAHPKCPCTRASIRQLHEIVAKLNGTLSVRVLFLKPEGSAEDWERTDLWQSAAAIPGARVIADVNGVEAQVWKVATSGQVLLYDAHGQLQFAGGITSARGHEGSSTGQEAILSLIRTGASERAGTPVFGCALQEPSRTNIKVR